MITWTPISGNPKQNAFPYSLDNGTQEFVLIRELDIVSSEFAIQEHSRIVHCISSVYAYIWNIQSTYVAYTTHNHTLVLCYINAVVLTPAFKKVRQIFRVLEV